MTKEEFKKQYGFNVNQAYIDELNKIEGYKEPESVSNIIHKMGVEIAREQDQFIFEKVNEYRANLGYTIYIHKDELIRDLKKVDEYEKQKKILDVLKKQIKKVRLQHSYINGTFIQEDLISGLVFCNSYENKDQYELLKEWIEND